MAHHHVRRALVSALATTVAGALGVTLFGTLRPSADPAAELTAAYTNPVTPGNFTGYGFDQCNTPSQSTMNAWLRRSPYLAVGVYIAGNSRGCREQKYLTPAWVHTQLTKGWRILPITVGPQASCYAHKQWSGADPKISATKDSHGVYTTATNQGIAEAGVAVAAAKALSIGPGSTMYYDLENFSRKNAGCNNSALAFLSGWTTQLHKLGYLSGVYSSGSSGITALNVARTSTTKYAMPDQLWIAQWDGDAGTDSGYVAATSWEPDARIKQYRGGHKETYDKVTINIDSDYVDVGSGTVAAPEKHYGGVNVGLSSYPKIAPPTKASKPDAAAVKALKSLLHEEGYAKAKNVNGIYATGLRNAINAFRKAHHWKSEARPVWTRFDWLVLLAAGSHQIVKYGSSGKDVFALQRSLNAANSKLHLPVTGVYASMTTAAVKAYEKKHKVAQSGVAVAQVWALLAAGKS